MGKISVYNKCTKRLRVSSTNYTSFSIQTRTLSMHYEKLKARIYSSTVQVTFNSIESSTNFGEPFLYASF